MIVRPERETLEAIRERAHEWAIAEHGSEDWAIYLYALDLEARLAALATAPDARLAEALEAVLMDANVTYGIISDDGTASPMMVERQAIVRAMGYEDESAWLARTAEINLAAAREETP